MLFHILAGALLLAAPLQHTDTTVAADAHGRLRVEGLASRVVVHTWSKDAVRMQTDDRGVRLRRAGSTVRVEAEPGRFGGGMDADIDLTLPATMAVSIHGPHTDVRIDGTRAEVVVETVRGDITVHGGTGNVVLHTVQGDVRLDGATGDIEAHSVGGDVTIDGASGPLEVQTIGGDVRLRGIRSSDVQATTVGGDVNYDGSIQPRGRYVFKTHNGDVTVSMPTDASATVAVSTFNGDFSADVPIRLAPGTYGRSFTFTLGSGSARVDLESFNGDITLVRPGSSGGD